jgi:hypothetical protein
MTKLSHLTASISTMLYAMMLLLVSSYANAADNSSEPKVKVDNNSFKCITDMTPVRHFYVDNLADVPPRRPVIAGQRRRHAHAVTSACSPRSPQQSPGVRPCSFPRVIASGVVVVGTPGISRSRAVVCECTLGINHELFKQSRASRSRTSAHMVV